MAEAAAPNQSTPVPIPTSSTIRAHTQEVFHVKPCLWQIKVVEAILQGGKDVLCIAGTGMGKSLTFWMPLLFRLDGIQIVVTPLNLLGKQNVEALARACIPAISISSETATPANFHAIRTHRYRAIVISPEQMMKPEGEFEKILRDAHFASHIISIVVDEAHCLTDWGEFRPEYRELGRIRFVLPSVPLLVASATLTASAISDVRRLLQLRTSKTIVLRRSSDRPNIKIGVQKIKYALNSFADLAFLVPDGYDNTNPPLPKFLVFFDDISDSIAAAKYLRGRLPHGLKEKIKWFNADMSITFKETEFANLTAGKTWGLCTTASFGMGMDVPDISLVVQWRATCNLAALWQRFGRAARNKELTGTALLLAEKEYFDDEKAAKAARKAKRLETRKRKAKEADLPDPLRPTKRAIANCQLTESSDSRNVGSTNVSSALDNDSLDEGSGDEGNAILVVNGRNSGGGDDERKTTMDEGRPEPSSRSIPPGKYRKRNLDPGIDLLINVGCRPGLGCRRAVFDTCFDNGAAETDHLQCNTEADRGCNRCHVQEPLVCCDLHNCTEFSPYASIVPKQRRAMQRSCLAKYTKGKRDYDLGNVLHNWREAKAAEVYGQAALNRHGPSLIMTNAILDSIVDYAHFKKINSLLDLKRETGWTRCEQFGGEILNLLQTHAPPPSPRLSPFVSTPLRPVGTALQANNTQAPSSPIVKRRNKCSACGQEGHNARNKICPRRRVDSIDLSKENMPLQ